MSVQYAFRQIVTNGLILSLDAADRNSYVGSGTVWSDVSGTSLTGSLVNGPTFNTNYNGYFTFDGNNDYFEMDPISSGSDSGTYTWDCWVFSSISGSSFIRGLDGFGTGWSVSIGVGLVSGIYTPGVSIVTTSPTTTQYSCNGSGSVSNKWFNVVGIWQPGVSLSVYSNGVLQAVSGNTSTNLRSSTKGWGTGRQPSTTYFTSSNATLKVYNRVLSQTEILQNYNAQKSRFGL